MIYNNFKLNIIIRILLIFAFLALLAFWIINGHYLRSVYIGILVIVLLAELFIYFDRLNNNLSNFFASLLSDDYSNRLSDFGKGRSFRKLYDILNAINEKLKILRKEKETRSQYLGSLIEQSGVGILSIDLNEVQEHTIVDLRKVAERYRGKCSCIFQLTGSGDEQSKRFRSVKFVVEPTEEFIAEVKSLLGPCSVRISA